MHRWLNLRLVWPWLLLLGCALPGCGDEPLVDPPAKDPTCAGLYGQPNASTGLDAAACFPRIVGDATWTPRTWDAAALASLRAWKLDSPPAVMKQSPYKTTPGLKPPPTAVCGVVVTGSKTYRLQTFKESTVSASIAVAIGAGAKVTHGGACGACTSLADLEVYARIPDQTEPVRKCAMSNLGGKVEKVDACIVKAVGFTAPCARAWSYNAMNDAQVCLEVCLKSLLAKEPYNLPDGSLNGCLQCDEDMSGPVFKATAGRTRRNSGLASAICRPCQTVWRIDHRYQ